MIAPVLGLKVRVALLKVGLVAWAHVPELVLNVLPQRENGLLGLFFRIQLTQFQGIIYFR